jgi:competence ComEA-like helix-hairpin-helix protein
MNSSQTAQERGLVLLLALALVVSGVFLLLDVQRPPAAVRVEPIVLYGVHVHLPRFVEIAPVDVNRASEEELTRLPGIGPALAARIVAFREAHGPFATLEDLERVSGIGPQTVLGLGDAAVAGSTDP